VELNKRHKALIVLAGLGLAGVAVDQVFFLPKQAEAMPAGGRAASDAVATSAEASSTAPALSTAHVAVQAKAERGKGGSGEHMSDRLVAFAESESFTQMPDNAVARDGFGAAPRVREMLKSPEPAQVGETGMVGAAPKLTSVGNLGPGRATAVVDGFTLVQGRVVKDVDRVTKRARRTYKLVRAEVAKSADDTHRAWVEIDGKEVELTAAAAGS
jgi:hypothetical protein